MKEEITRVHGAPHIRYLIQVQQATLRMSLIVNPSSILIKLAR